MGSKAGIVLLVIDDDRTIRLGVPEVDRDVRRLLEVAGPLIKDNNHYTAKCDKNERSLISGILQRLQTKHRARILTADPGVIRVAQSK
jgi:hypothetical protein